MNFHRNAIAYRAVDECCKTVCEREMADCVCRIVRKNNGYPVLDFNPKSVIRPYLNFLYHSLLSFCFL